MWENGRMKTTIELPDILLRQARALAAERGVTLEHFITEALREHLRRGAIEHRGTGVEPPWMAGFGGLSDLGDDHRRVLEAIAEEFEGTAPENLA